uniref:Uncharacterized protein n=1 Tax=Globisporangium ultimum (strain ATCC 200006 / CBS 805.95 / DAOM BR144) TaxID=431595 RepID=K3WB32_GLOUD
MDSKEDWKKLKAIKYGDSRVLAFCASTRREALGRYIMCAWVYEEELLELAGNKVGKTSSTTSSIALLREAVANSQQLEKAFKTGAEEGEWSALA